MNDRLEDALRQLAGSRPLTTEDRADLTASLASLRQEIRELQSRERVFRDVVQDRNREFEEKIFELSVVKETLDFAASSPEDEALREIVRTVVARFAARAGGVLGWDEGTGELAPLSIGGREERSFGPAAIVAQCHPILRDAIRSGAPVVVPELAVDRRLERTEDFSAGSVLALPLLGPSDRAFGAFFLTHDTPLFFTPSRLRVLRMIGSQLVSVLRARELRAALHSTSGEVEAEVRDRTEALQNRTTDLASQNETMTELYLALEDTQRQLEERTRQIERALAFNDRLVESVNVGIGVVRPDRTVVAWNAAMGAVSGGVLARERWLGRPVAEIPTFLRERLDLDRALAAAIDDGAPTSATDLGLDPEHATRRVNLHVLPVLLGAADERHAIVVVEDVSSNAALVDERVRSERLAAVTATMVSVNHEVNNPLAVILGYAQMGLGRLDPDRSGDDPAPRLRDDLARIEAEALRIQEITATLASLVEPVLTEYPAADGMPMVDLEASRLASQLDAPAGRPAAPALPPAPDNEAARSGSARDR